MARNIVRSITSTTIDYSYFDESHKVITDSYTTLAHIATDADAIIELANKDIINVTIYNIKSNTVKYAISLEDFLKYAHKI